MAALDLHQALLLPRRPQLTATLREAVQLLLQANCTVTVAHSRTKDLSEVVRRSDIVVAADDCRFSQLEVKRGIMATGGATLRGDVRLDRPFGDEEAGGQCGVGQPLGEQAQHFAFAVRQICFDEVCVHLDSSGQLLAVDRFAQRNAPDLNPRNFTAMTRLDENRAVAMLAKKVGVGVEEVNDLVIWGNHSPTMFPHLANAKVNGKSGIDAIGGDMDWYENEYMPKVGKLGLELDMIMRVAADIAGAAGSGADVMQRTASSRPRIASSTPARARRGVRSADGVSASAAISASARTRWWSSGRCRPNRRD